MLAVALSLVLSRTEAANDFEQPPINYSRAIPRNCISRLQDRLNKGVTSLSFEREHGYLKGLLNALEIPVESQVLVFSKTSLQRRRITPETPRAVYFNDSAYVGYCQSGDLIEISALDPQLGAVFYSLKQEEVGHPAIIRRTDNCMVCHSSSRTGGVPGFIVRSLFVDTDGQPMQSAGNRNVNHTTPIRDRWGGWYVTGTHGQQTHVGNLVMQTSRIVRPVDNRQGQNVRDLRDRIETDHYLSPHSDIVALMILEHQTLVQNCLTRAMYAGRQVLHDNSGQQPESTDQRIVKAGDELVKALLLVNEAPLTDSVRGTSGYEDVFANAGERDRQSRSLRDLNLSTRMFQYPCSYLIYSDSFDSLPEPVLNYVWQRMWNILRGEDSSAEFEHLSGADRRAITEILRDTKSGLPEYWKPPSPTAAEQGTGSD